MANRIQYKDRVGSRAFAYGALQTNGFQAQTITINQINTTVQDFIVLPFACKIPLVTVAFNVTQAASGVTALNIVTRGAAEAGALTADNSDVQYPPTLNGPATSGYSLFQNAGNTAPQDLALSASAVYLGVTYPTSEPDAIFPQNTVLTLRYVSGGAVSGIMKVIMVLIPVEIKQNNPASGSTFSWANDVG